MASNHIWSIGSGQTTCSTRYSCDYGFGFDQVCDNQRWGLQEVLGGLQWVFSLPPCSSWLTRDLLSDGTGNGRMVSRWGPRHNSAYRGSFGPPASAGRYRCVTDKFPLNSLVESGGFAPQALRELDGNENGAQGRDWQLWLAAVWYPCSALLQAPPPVTWRIGDPPVETPERLRTESCRSTG
jgi:hypothetical protein